MMQRPLAQSWIMSLKVEQGVNTRNKVKVTAGAVLPGCQEGPWVGPAVPWKFSFMGEQKLWGYRGTGAGPSQARLFSCTLSKVQAMKQSGLCPVRELVLVLAPGL